MKMPKKEVIKFLWKNSEITSYLHSVHLELLFQISVAQSVVAEEYTDSTSAEG